MTGTYGLASWFRRRACAVLLALLACSAALRAQQPDTTKPQKTETTPVHGQRFDNPLLPAPRLNTGSLKASGGFGGARLMTATGSLGATVGGAQDIGYARQLIESGHVPAFIDFSPEGLYSEHDIPTPSSDCDAKLCLSLGYGLAPTADNGSNALFVQLGLGSNIRPEEFRRTPLQLALVIDKSGSMQGASMDAVKQALRSLLDRLGPDDELMLVEFNTRADLLLKATHVTDRTPILAAIDALRADGGTDIEAGLRLGFGQIDSLPARAGTSKRLMLFTDAMPNAGRTDSASFR